jgi:hypothetical protein
MDHSWVSYHKLGEEGGVVERNGEVCTEYESASHPVVTSSGGLLFVSPENKYYYNPKFLHDSIRFLIDHDEVHPVMRAVSEGLINDFRGAVEEFKFYAEEDPKHWNGVGVAEEILEVLEHLAGKLGTSLKEIEEDDLHFDPYEEDETANDPYV